eukprot:gene7741-biopygen10562
MTTSSARVVGGENEAPLPPARPPPAQPHHADGSAASAGGVARLLPVARAAVVDEARSGAVEEPLPHHVGELAAPHLRPALQEAEVGAVLQARGHPHAVARPRVRDDLLHGRPHLGAVECDDSFGMNLNWSETPAGRSQPFPSVVLNKSYKVFEHPVRWGRNPQECPFGQTPRPGWEIKANSLSQFQNWIQSQTDSAHAIVRFPIPNWIPGSSILKTDPVPADLADVTEIQILK